MKVDPATYLHISFQYRRLLDDPEKESTTKE
jgi:hypothetical protein